MFNFIASALLSYLLVNVLKEPGNMTVESRASARRARCRRARALAALGIEWPRSPLNLSVLLALLPRCGRALLLWRSAPATRCARSAQRPERRATPASAAAPDRLAMALSGALAGLVGINEIAGVHGRLLLDYVVGAGFAGIAVSLIGRNHPVGIVLASLLFGALYQGGAELAFEIPGFSRDMVYTLQGLIVLFSGAMAQVAAPSLRAGLVAGWQQRRRSCRSRPMDEIAIGTLIASTLRCRCR
jgi:simple sugar transport system permease protein